jgi:hypothetical protein
VATAHEQGWATLTNGELLAAAESHLVDYDVVNVRPEVRMNGVTDTTIDAARDLVEETVAVMRG